MPIPALSSDEKEIERDFEARVIIYKAGGSDEKEIERRVRMSSMQSPPKRSDEKEIERLHHLLSISDNLLESSDEKEIESNVADNLDVALFQRAPMKRRLKGAKFPFNYVVFQICSDEKEIESSTELL